MDSGPQQSHYTKSTRSRKIQTHSKFQNNYAMDVRDGGSMCPHLCNGKVGHNVLFLNFLFYIGVQPINNMIASDARQSNSTIHNVVVIGVQPLSHAQLFVTLWTVVRQAPLSMGFSRQEYGGGLPFPPPGDLPNPRIKLASLLSPALAGRFFTTRATWEAQGYTNSPYK